MNILLIQGLAFTYETKKIEVGQGNTYNNVHSVQLYIVTKSTFYR